VDGTVLGFTLLTAMVAGLLCGVAPALSATRVDPNGQLKEGERNLGGGRRGRRMRSALVVAEVSMAMVLLAGAGLMVKSFVRLMRVDAGLDPAHVLTLNVLPPLEKYPDPWRRAEMFPRVHAALARVPGVAASAGATAMPPDVLQRVTAFEVEGMPELPPSERFADFVAATPDWFRVLGVPMAAGRAFTERDGRDAPPVVIINESLARRLFPRGEAVGRQLRLRNSEHAPDLRTIVGVAGEVRYRGLDAPARSSLYTPFDQTPWFGQYVLVRTRSAPEGLAGAIERAVAAVDPDLFTAAVMPLDRVVSRSVATPRFQVLLLATFAALALGLAAIGIYGVLAYQVAERSHEFGIRMALGARRGDLFRLVLRWGMWLAVLGMALGAGGALALTRFLAGLLFEVRPTDPLTFALVAALMGGVALSACCLPARRATLGDPVSALHHE
jgi:putative ABC transport system permease protein